MVDIKLWQCLVLTILWNVNNAHHSLGLPLINSPTPWPSITRGENAGRHSKSIVHIACRLGNCFGPRVALHTLKHGHEKHRDISAGVEHRYGGCFFFSWESRMIKQRRIFENMWGQPVYGVWGKCWPRWAAFMTMHQHPLQTTRLTSILMHCMILVTCSNDPDLHWNCIHFLHFPWPLLFQKQIDDDIRVFSNIQYFPGICIGIKAFHLFFLVKRAVRLMYPTDNIPYKRLWDSVLLKDNVTIPFPFPHSFQYTLKTKHSGEQFGCQLALLFINWHEPNL